MEDKQKDKKDLEAAKGWLAIAKEKGNNLCVQILEDLFPELRKSEDERIRNFLIKQANSVLESITDDDEEVPAWKSALAWLEKQGEKHVEQDTEIHDLWVYIREWNDKFGRLPKDEDELASCIDYVMKRLNPSWNEKSDERIHTIKVFFPSIGGVEEAIEKGIEYSKKEGDMLISINGIFLLVTQLSTVEKVMEEYNKCVGNCNDIKEKVNPMVQRTTDDELYLKGVICDIECEVLCANCSRNIADMKIKWLKSLKDRVQPQQKQEWSEEDENIRKQLIKHCSGPHELYDERNWDKWFNWLKSLKDRVQPKQEWSEEDEGFLNLLLAIFTNEHPNGVFTTDNITVFKGNCVTSNRIIAWLKSLEPNHWKPSEEQLEALKHYVDTTMDGEIELLYNDLTKL